MYGYYASFVVFAVRTSTTVGVFIWFCFAVRRLRRFGFVRQLFLRALIMR